VWLTVGHHPGASPMVNPLLREVGPGGTIDGMAFDPRVFTLHRYYIWANRMRTHFDDLLKGGEVKGLFTGRGGQSIEATMYMSLWYALLYVVVEGWRRLRLSDPVIDELLSKADHVRVLKRYRHGVAHFQSNYVDSRFTEIMKDSEATVPWIRDLNRELGRWFLAYLRENPPAPGEPPLKESPQ